MTAMTAVTARQDVRHLNRPELFTKPLLSSKSSRFSGPSSTSTPPFVRSVQPSRSSRMLYSPCTHATNTPAVSFQPSTVENPSNFNVGTAPIVLSNNVLRVYSRIYESMGGYVKWQGDRPLLSPTLLKQFEAVKENVAQGAKIHVAMAHIVV